jgi:arsenite methyltransferase
MTGKLTQVSKSAAGKFNYPTGRDGALQQGYDPAIIQSMPDELIESFCGVRNPFTLGAIKPGETILDVGCGAGFDLIVASRIVGRDGKVCGIASHPKWQKKPKEI